MDKYRIEYKYYLPLEIRGNLLSDFQAFTFQDEHSRKEDGKYSVSFGHLVMSDWIRPS